MNETNPDTVKIFMVFLYEAKKREVKLRSEDLRDEKTSGHDNLAKSCKLVLEKRRLSITKVPPCISRSLREVKKTNFVLEENERSPVCQTFPPFPGMLTHLARTRRIPRYPDVPTSSFESVTPFQAFPPFRGRAQTRLSGSPWLGTTLHTRRCTSLKKIQKKKKEKKMKMIQHARLNPLETFSGLKQDLNLSHATERHAGSWHFTRAAAQSWRMSWTQNARLPL